MPDINTSTQKISVSDKSTMSAFVARPASAARAPAVVVLQEAFGVNNHICDVAQRFARLGWVAIAPELFHRSAQEGTTVPYEDFPQAMVHLKQVTSEGLEADLAATHHWLANDKGVDPTKIAAVGYCMGGRAAFIANAKLPLVAAVSYYGGGLVPDLLSLAKDQRGPLQLIWGGLDKHIGYIKQRAVADALREHGKRFVEVDFSDADHGFFCDEKAVFNPAAAKQAWALTTTFLAVNFGTELRG